MSKVCDYVYVGGLRLPSDQVVVNVTHPDGRVERVGVVAKSKGRESGYRSLKDLASLARSGASLTASVYVGGEKVSESFPFDPSSSRGRRGRRARSTTTPTPIGGVSRSSDGSVDPRVFDVALRGISYGDSAEVSAQNVRQMHWLLFSRGGEQRLLETLRSSAGGSAARERRILAVRGIADMINADKRFVEERPDVMVALWATSAGREAAAAAVSLGYAPEVARLEYMASPSTDTPGRLREHTVMVLSALARTEDLGTLAAVASTGEETFALAAYKRMEALSGGSTSAVIEAAIAAGIPFESARGFLRYGVNTVERMQLLEDIKVSPQDLEHYASAGVHEFSDVVLLARNRVDGAAARQYAESGLSVRPSVEEMLSFQEAKLLPVSVRVFAAAGHREVAGILDLAAAGVDSGDAQAYAEAGVRDTADVLALVRADVKPAAAVAYARAGIGSPASMIELVRNRVFTEAARLFAEAGFSVKETIALNAAGMSMQTHDNDAPRSPVPPVAFVPGYVKAGFAEVEEMLLLSHAGVAPATALVYRAAGVERAGDICLLHEGGLSAHEALKLSETGVSASEMLRLVAPEY